MPYSVSGKSDQGSVFMLSVLCCADSQGWCKWGLHQQEEALAMGNSGVDCVVWTVVFADKIC